MATGKRYYWIKLKDSFMSSDEIDYLMSQPDGANYVVLYQMLCLKTINTNGCLVSKIGEMLIPYDAEKIQRECKWFPLSTVRLALTVYKQIGLIFENPDGTLSISDYQNMIGSETDWAAKNRRIRSNAANKELQEGHDTGHTSGHNVSSDGGENVPTEKEIEKDKEIENRERVRDNGSTAVDAGLSEIIRSFEDNIGSFPPAASDALMGWREIFTDDLILLAIKKAALAGIRKWNYVNGILKAWKNEGVKTIGDVQSRDERRNPPAGQQQKPSAKDDYDAIFTGDLGAVGKRILLDLLKEKGYDIESIYQDCGLLIFDGETQDTHSGGSGCGCSASVLAAYILPELAKGTWKRVLFVPTGALLSKTSFNEGDSIPGIAHAVVLEHVSKKDQKQ